MNFLSMFSTDNTIPGNTTNNLPSTDRTEISSDSDSDFSVLKVAGENGTMQLTADAVGDVRLLLFAGISRDTPSEKLNSLVTKYIDSITAENQVEMICDLFVIMFEKRDCRGGEGEKQLFIDIFNKIFSIYPDLTVAVVSLVPFYGSWLDIWKIATIENQVLLSEIFNVSSKQMLEDIQSLNDDKIDNITLCAKWTPSEGTQHYRKLETKINNYLKMIFPESTTLQKDYRKTVKILREKINVTEQLMCSGRWADIDPKKTPSVCTNKNRKSFLNLSLKEEMTTEDWETGNRYRNNQDRVKCRQRWMKAVKEGVVKGKQLDPVTLVDAVQSTTDQSELDLIDAQYNNLLKKIRNKINQSIMDGNIPMDNIIPMVDMSGSMSGLPMSAAIGLGIMLSELCNPKYSNTLISFTSTCDVVHLDHTQPFSERVKHIMSLPVGYSTNFDLAMQRVCKIVKEKRLEQHELPSICILSDMQMDCSHMFGYSSTTDEKIKKMFENVGNELCGTPYTRPRTVHWNLRANVSGYPVEAHENNVQSITGYSASLLDLILSGKPNPTPFETMRRKLDEERYDIIRETITPIIEGWR